MTGTGGAHYTDDRTTVWHGDCLHVLRDLPDSSVDAIVTDPPYGLEFMGKDWDSFRYSNTGPQHTDFKNLGPLPTFSPTRRNQKCPECNKWAYDHVGRKCECGGWKQPAQQGYNRAFAAWCEQWARECLRVLKPGGHMIAFGGTRTWHRLVCAVEDAGFEIRDSLAWLYGSGFPKSLAVGKAIDKAAGVELEAVGPVTPEAEQWWGWGTALKPAWEPIVVARKPLTGTVAANVLAHGTGALNIDGCRAEGVVPQVVQGAQDHIYGNGKGLRREPSLSRPHDAGRWPANLLLTHGDCADQCEPGCPVAELDRQSGESTSQGGSRGVGARGYAGGPLGIRPDVGAYGDIGGASRFFPVFRYEPKAPMAERPRTGQTAHPTVKPLDLTRWLVRLVTPPGGLVLDPFAGTGTTGEAARLEGCHAILVEQDPDYLPLIVQRLTRRTDPVRHLVDKGEDLGLFAGLDDTPDTP